MTNALATMIEAGLPVLDAIAMAKEQANHKRLLPVVQEIYKDVESGKPLSAAFGRFDKSFDSVYINMLKAGEASGKLDEFLNKLVLVLEKREIIKSSIKKIFIALSIIIGSTNGQSPVILKITSALYFSAAL